VRRKPGGPAVAPKHDEHLLEKIRDLEGRLEEAEATLTAIRTGAVDAFVASGPDGDVVYTLQGADAGYRLFLEQMAEGALTVSDDGLILFTNDQFARMLGLAPERLLGSHLPEFVGPEGKNLLDALLSANTSAKAELCFQRADGQAIPAYVSASHLRRDGIDCVALVVTDLTEQKRNQEILAAGKLAQTILEQAAVPIVVTDPDGRIIQANNAAGQLAGTQVLLRNFDTVFDLSLPPENDFLGFGRILGMLHRRPAGIAGLQAVSHTSNGHSFDVLINAATLAGPASETLGCIVVLVDITERKLSEQRLRESYRLLNLLLDQSPLAVIESDSDFRVTRWTGTAQQIFGWSAAEVLGKRIDELPLIYPDDEWRVNQTILEMFSGVRPSSIIKSRNLRKDRSVIQCEWYNSCIHDNNGRLVAVLSRVLDVTERKRAEDALRASNERFQRLQESNVIGIISADTRKVYEANDLFLSMIGFTREELNRGIIEWRQLTPPEFLPLGERAIEELLETGSYRPFEKEYIRKDGSRVPVLIGGTLLDRATSRHISFILDLTARKKLESKLQQKDKLESLGLLAGGIAHDFNNLLVGIMGNAGLAQEMAPPGSTLSVTIESILKCSQSAAHLTRQMLAYAGKGQFILERVHLPRVVEETLKLVRSTIPGGVSLHLELDRSVSAVEADASQMQQVVMNLLMNAAEAIGEDRGVIVVRTTNCTLERPQLQNDFGDPPIDPGPYVLLEVRDTGCGMDEATKARIFDPFFSTKFLGRGLGLAAVAGIVRAHKGAIRVVSVPQKGSTFTVYFPAAAQAARAAAEGIPDTPKTVYGSETVLIVDDEPTVLETAKLSLERHGYTVFAAGNGQAAIEILKRERERVSLVLLDLSMPGMGGQDTLQQLLKVEPDVDVMVSSGYTEAEAMRFFAGMRVCGFVQKPYTAARLAHQINAAIASRRSSRRRTA
jgi:PAS domain S-box-containing protein